MNKLQEQFRKYSDEEYLEFERIPAEQKLHSDDSLCGYLKVYSLLKEGKNLVLDAEHDVIFLAARDKLKNMTDDDVIYLLRCGISYDEESDGLVDYC